MTPRRLRTAPVLACAAALVLGCGAATDAVVPASSGPTPSVANPSASTPDPQPEGPLIDQLLAARSAGDPQAFASLVARAAASCTDPAASRRLGQLSAVAGRWADSIAFARPKAQARTEAQLTEVDWEQLVASCDAAPAQQ